MSTDWNTRVPKPDKTALPVQDASTSPEIVQLIHNLNRQQAILSKLRYRNRKQIRRGWGLQIY